jgi:hypothetical protein
MEPSFELEDFVSTPSDAGFPSASSYVPPALPSDMYLIRRQSAIAAAIESWEPPDLSSTHTDRELVENYLRPVVQPTGFSEESREDILSRWYAQKRIDRINPSVVNTDLPLVNPSELPGM